MKTLLWIGLDSIPFIIAFQVNPPKLGFAIGLLLAIAVFVFQKTRFKQVNTLVKVKVAYFVAGLLATIFVPQVPMFDYTQLFIYGILSVTTLLSLWMGEPFTLQYAKKTVSEKVWNNPLFIATNWWMTLMWAVLFSLSLLFSITYAAGITGGETGVLLTNIWSIAGFALTIIIPRVVRGMHRKKQGAAKL